MESNANRFESLTVFVLASNETEALNNTVSKIKSLQHYKDISKILLVVKGSDCPAYSVAKKIIAASDSKIEMYIQKSDCFELCLTELPPLVKGSHFVIMAGDGEMDPQNIDTFIIKAKEHPERIICATKWHKDSIVHGYSKFNKFGSHCVNFFISLLFNRKVRDACSLYQIFPMSVYIRLNYDYSPTFCYEYTIKALRNNVEYEEIPTVYRKRTEGKSNFSYAKLFSAAFLFCSVALKIRLKPKEDNYQKSDVIR